MSTQQHKACGRNRNDQRLPTLFKRLVYPLHYHRACQTADLVFYVSHKMQGSQAYIMLSIWTRTKQFFYQELNRYLAYLTRWASCPMFFFCGNQTQNFFCWPIHNSEIFFSFKFTPYIRHFQNKYRQPYAHFIRRASGPINQSLPRSAQALQITMSYIHSRPQ